MTSASTYSEQEQAPGTVPEPEKAPAGPALPGLEELPVRRPPALHELAVWHGSTPSGDEVTVLLSQLALKHIAAHANSNLQCEVGGALLGRAYRWQDRAYVDVHAAIPAVTADHGPVHFTFTADAWSQLHHDREQRFPDLDIVGWFHTHPDLGVFYSSDDVIVHSAAFTQPWHIGLVVDPLRLEAAIFGWQREGLGPLSGFYERLDLQPESLLPWHPVETAVWNHPYEYGAHGEAGGSAVYLPPSQLPGLPAFKSYFGYALGALGLLLSLIMLVGWVLPLTREVDRLQNTVVVLADTALADSNAALCPDMRLRILTPLAGQQMAAGENLEVTGTAMFPEAVRYQVDVRAGGSESWALVGRQRGDVKLGRIARWDTTAVPPGDYLLRLSAVDSNNLRLAGSPDCAIPVQVTP
jgi:proteasome lid subunit RPN8/RPN11